MTRDELLSQMPELDLSSFNALSPSGDVMDIQEALLRLGKYSRYNQDLGLKQTFCVGFDSEKLITWLLSIRGRIDQIKIWFSLDEDDKITVIIWPYTKGLPARKGEAATDDSLEPYNYGNRHPLD